MPAADDVLAEMAALGVRGTELGPPGFLPTEPVALKALLDRYGLQLVGQFVPLVLHEPDIATARRVALDATRLVQEAGGDVLVLALVQDEQWAAPQILDDEAWKRVAAHLGEIVALISGRGLTPALHPHAGTLIETADDVQRALEELDVGWCLDTGHLLIGGVEPAAFVRDHGERIVHVHLKDVDAGLASEVSSGALSLLQATRRGLFLPLGRGDAGISAVLDGLRSHEYDRWFVLEQDTALTADEPAVPSGPMLDASESIAFLDNSARRTQEVNR
jgi:inosose dehydratase